MRRREFITVVGGAAAWPLEALAQPREPVRRVGVLMSLAESDLEGQRYITEFVRGLREAGWTPGHNLQIEYRWAGSDIERIRAHAAELVDQKPDAILAQTALVLVPLQRETHTIPIIFTQVADPVESGFVATLTHPGGNVTGFTPLESSVAGKWLEMLREIAPNTVQAAVIFNPAQSPNVRLLRAVEAAAQSFSAQVTAAGVRDRSGLESTIEAFASKSNGGLIVAPNPITLNHPDLIVALAARYRLPAIYPYKFFVARGGLMSYGADIPDLFRRAGSYVDRILRGGKIADLPIQNPTKFELAVNLKTAKALGLTVPATLLARADEVIE